MNANRLHASLLALAGQDDENEDEIHCFEKALNSSYQSQAQHANGHMCRDFLFTVELQLYVRRTFSFRVKHGTQN